MPVLATKKANIMSLVHPVNTSFCLEKLCESNYQKLFNLIPSLGSILEKATGKATNKPVLYLTIIDRTIHTLTIELSHCFDKNLQNFMTPAVKIRIYLDADLAEVLNDHARTDVSRVYKNPGKTVEIMNYKWKLNYFLQKWLDYCLQNNYQFEPNNKPTIE